MLSHGNTTAGFGGYGVLKLLGEALADSVLEPWSTRKRRRRNRWSFGSIIDRCTRTPHAKVNDAGQETQIDQSTPRIPPLPFPRMWRSDALDKLYLRTQFFTLHPSSVARQTTMASYDSPEVRDHSPQKDVLADQQMSLRRYLATRIPTLRPPMAKAPSPFKLLALLNLQQWLFFLVAFIAWSWDAFDFFTVSLTVTQLSKQFDKKPSQITWGITLVLMFRSVGAIIFGIAADRYGRKWPFVVNNILFIVLELGTGFCNTYDQFLACRALFGIAMGGLYGNAAATALEDCPEAARGILSGMLQQGYAFGYLLATVFARGLVDTTSHGWRPLFWFGACPPVLIIAFRLCLPETKSYIERDAVRKANGSVASTFIAEGKVALKKHWLLLSYLVLLMAGFNFMSHGSQDLYPQMLENQFEFSHDAVTVTQVVANLGAMTGGTVIGYCKPLLSSTLPSDSQANPFIQPPKSSAAASP
ncbi:MAG: hypothetical protein Q9170_006932 [Blastenia crenularia]